MSHDFCFHYKRTVYFDLYTIYYIGVTIHEAVRFCLQQPAFHKIKSTSKRSLSKFLRSGVPVTGAMKEPFFLEKKKHFSFSRLSGRAVMALLVELREKQKDLQRSLKSLASTFDAWWMLDDKSMLVDLMSFF